MPHPYKMTQVLPQSKHIQICPRARSLTTTPGGRLVDRELRLSREVDSKGWALDAERAGLLLQFAMRRAVGLVPAHVLHGGELGLGDDGEAERQRVLVRFAGADNEDIWLAVLDKLSALAPYFFSLLPSLLPSSMSVELAARGLGMEDSERLSPSAGLSPVSRRRR
jgi:hypothetical protein